MEDGVGQQRGVLDVPQDKGLYSFRNEHDACGVGMVANLDNRAEHAIIENGLTVLKRLMHRGAAGGDPETGDGAGLLFSIPDKFFRKVLKKTKLPPVGQYGVAVVVTLRADIGGAMLCGAVELADVGQQLSK